MSPSRRQRFLPIDFRMEEHRGEWIVLVNDCVVETGTDLCTCLARTREKHPREEPFVMKVLPRGGAPRLRPPHPPRRR
ncbi:MAG: hypothetical protein KGJ23_05250 [Euryarchaeota archaeon]|nr:hypothetical protein [Euryarchaeota archaeon]MDE1836006.1 hypothetical protein [Euryarchaeota archaeon]MDE2046002.1 hypothetical protein [Thermoplasmata archaeon]